MEILLYSGLFIPLAGFLILLSGSSFFGRRAAGVIGCSSVFLSFLCFCFLVYRYHEHGMVDRYFTLFAWLPIDKIEANFSLHVDALSLLMSLIITGVGFLIHLYSNGYMEHEKGIVRYFACMNLFIFAMLLLVSADNLLLLFVGWEGVGLASYLLIGFDYDRASAAQAAVKAFVMNRIGDFGLLLGILFTFYFFGTGEMSAVSEKAGTLFEKGAPILTLITLLYFVGAIGKSAQIPLHTWLPDAMEGPTPVSALIHAATMVTAGVYLIVRMHAVFMLTPVTMQVVGFIGAVTSLFAAVCAFGQTDLKKVLAYSTVSQLGLMFVAAGAGAFYAAMFHLTMHAFMKSLLFLSAGNIVHMLGGTTEMKKMGGLRTKMKATHRFFLIGVLAMSGIPPFAAFFSKDMILEQEYMAGFEFLFYISLGGSILTGVYLIRAYCLTFLGTSRTDREDIREAPPVMIYSIVLLAFLSLTGGFIGFFPGEIPVLASFLREIGINPIENQLMSKFTVSYETLLTIGGAVIGVLLSYLIYTRYPDKIGPNYAPARFAFYIDNFYEKIIVNPLKSLSESIVRTIEPEVIEGSVLGICRGVEDTAGEMQRMQSGRIRSYIAWMAIGGAGAIAYFIL